MTEDIGNFTFLTTNDSKYAYFEKINDIYRVDEEIIEALSSNDISGDNEYIFEEISNDVASSPILKVKRIWIEPEEISEKTSISELLKVESGFYLNISFEDLTDNKLDELLGCKSLNEKKLKVILYRDITLPYPVELEDEIKKSNIYLIYYAKSSFEINEFCINRSNNKRYHVELRALGELNLNDITTKKINITITFRLLDFDNSNKVLNLYLRILNEIKHDPEKFQRRSKFFNDVETLITPKILKNKGVIIYDNKLSSNYSLVCSKCWASAICHRNELYRIHYKTISKVKNSPEQSIFCDKIRLLIEKNLLFLLSNRENISKKHMPVEISIDDKYSLKFINP